MPCSRQSRAHFRVTVYNLRLILIRLFTAIELPVLPQRFDLTGEHYLPPPTPVIQPSTSSCTRKRKALIVRGRINGYHMLILMSF